MGIFKRRLESPEEFEARMATKQREREIREREREIREIEKRTRPTYEATEARERAEKKEARRKIARGYEEDIAARKEKRERKEILEYGKTKAEYKRGVRQAERRAQVEGKVAGIKERVKRVEKYRPTITERLSRQMPPQARRYAKYPRRISRLARYLPPPKRMDSTPIFGSDWSAGFYPEQGTGIESATIQIRPYQRYEPKIGGMINVRAHTRSIGIIQRGAPEHTGVSLPKMLSDSFSGLGLSTRGKLPNLLGGSTFPNLLSPPKKGRKKNKGGLLQF